jgi:hypothetical protein
MLKLSAKEMHHRQAARARIFDGARELADALMDYEGPERWEPLRDLILAGLEAGGLRCADSKALRTAAGELSTATLDAHRHVAHATGPTPDRRSERP